LDLNEFLVDANFADTVTAQMKAYYIQRFRLSQEMSFWLLLTLLIISH
jgi:hypothetical protein